MRAISPGDRPANWEVKAGISRGNSPVKLPLSLVVGAGAVGAAVSTATVHFSRAGMLILDGNLLSAFFTALS